MLDRQKTADLLEMQQLFHSQFQLSLDKYRDNNNFIRHNSLKFNIDRWSLSPQEYVQEFLDYVAFPPWIGPSYYWTIRVSRDGGKTDKEEQHLMLFGCYFFLSDDKVEQFKLVSKITEIIAIMSGLTTLLFHASRIVVKAINRKQLEAKAIR